MNLPTELPDGPTIWTGVGGIAAAIMYMRRKLSRDKVEVMKDSAEVNLISTLQAERDAARAGEAEAWKTRNEDAKLIGQLESKVIYLTEVNSQMKEQLSEMRASHAQTRREVHDLRSQMMLMRGDGK